MKKLSKLWYLEKFSILQILNKNDLVHMERSMVMKKIDKNVLVHFPEMQRKFVYFLKEGIIKVVNVNEEGQEFIKYLLKPGNLFGELALMDTAEDADDYAVALEDCLICFMDLDTMKEMMHKNPVFDRQVKKLVGLRIKKIENRLSAMVFKNSRERIKDFLLEFAREFGEPVTGGYQVRNFLTHDDIGKLTATTRQTVSTILNEFKTLGYLTYDSRKMLIYAADETHKAMS